MLWKSAELICHTRTIYYLKYPFITIYCLQLLGYMMLEIRTKLLTLYYHSSIVYQGKMLHLQQSCHAQITQEEMNVPVFLNLFPLLFLHLIHFHLLLISLLSFLSLHTSPLRLSNKVTSTFYRSKAIKRGIFLQMTISFIQCQFWLRTSQQKL